MKTKLFYLFVGAIALTFASCEQDNVSEAKQLTQSKNNSNNLVANTVGLTPCTVADLMAGQNYDSGD
jgi:hypothetical protein